MSSDLLNNDEFFQSCKDGNLHKIKRLIHDYPKRFKSIKISEMMHDTYGIPKLIVGKSNKDGIFVKIYNQKNDNYIIQDQKLYPGIIFRLKIYKHCLIIACRNGNLQLVKWILDKIPILNTNYLELFQVACQNGQLQIAQWLHQNLKHDNDPYLPRDSDIRNSFSSSFYLKYYKKIFHLTCIAGHLVVAQWLFQKIPNLLIQEDLLIQICTEKSQNDKTAMLDWLFNLWENPKPVKNLPKNKMIQNRLSNSDATEYEIWYPPYDPDDDDDDYSYDDFYPIRIPINKNQKQAVDNQAVDNQIAHEDQLIKIQQKLKKEFLNVLFASACEAGCFSVIKYLIKQFPNIKFQLINNAALIIACENNNLDLLQWLVNYFNIQYNAEIDYGFVFACENGYLQLAKWLLQHFPQINVSSFSHYAIRTTCFNDHIETFKWLLEITSDTSYRNYIPYLYNYSNYNSACRNYIKEHFMNILEYEKYKSQLKNGPNYLDDNYLDINDQNFLTMSTSYETYYVDNMTSFILPQYLIQILCQYDKVEMLKWICTKNKLDIYSIYQKAIQYQSFYIINYLQIHYYDICTYIEQCYVSPDKYLKYQNIINKSAMDINYNIEECFSFACQNGLYNVAIDLLKKICIEYNQDSYLYQQWKQTGINNSKPLIIGWIDDYTNMALIIAAQHNNSHILEYYYQHTEWPRLRILNE